VTEELCHCGLPLHYSDPDIRQSVENLISRLGPSVKVTIDHRTWLVSRHYIALHGLKGAEVESLGFQPFSIKCPQCGVTSYNPNDVKNRYCGNCHQFHEEMK